MSLMPPNLTQLGKDCLNISLTAKTPCLNVRLDGYILVVQPFKSSRKANKGYQAALFQRLIEKCEKPLPRLCEIDISGNLTLNKQAKIILAIYKHTIRPCCPDVEWFHRKCLQFFLEWHSRTYFDAKLRTPMSRFEPFENRSLPIDSPSPPPFSLFRPLRLAPLLKKCLGVDLNEKTPCLDVGAKKGAYSIVSQKFSAPLTLNFISI